MANAASGTKVTKTVSYKYPTDTRKKLMDLALTNPRRKAKRHLPLSKKPAVVTAAPGSAPETAQRRPLIAPDNPPEGTEIDENRQLVVHIIPLPVRENQRVIRPETPLQKLPLSLGRKELATWWWQACPNCHHGDYTQIKPSTSSFCRPHCLPLAKEVDCLSKSMIKIDEAGELMIVGKNPKLVQILDREQGGQKRVQRKIISIGNPGEDPYMKFRLDIFGQKKGDKECRKAPDTVGFLSTKRRKNTVTPSPHCKRVTEKCRKVVDGDDDDSTCVSWLSSPSEWIFAANNTATKLRQARSSFRKRPRTLKFPSNESDTHLRVKQSARLSKKGDHDSLGLSDENTPSPSRLPSEVDASRFPTPRHNNKSSSGKVSSPRRPRALTTSNNLNRLVKRDYNESTSTDDPSLLASSSPARRELFARSVNDVNTDPNKLQNESPSQVVQEKAAKEMPQTLSVLTDEFEEGQDALGEPADAEFSITTNDVDGAIHGERTQFLTPRGGTKKDTATQDSNQEMIGLLLALKKKQKEEEENDQTLSIAPRSKPLSRKFTRNEGLFATCETSNDSGCIPQPRNRGKQTEDEKNDAVLEETAFSRSPQISSSSFHGDNNEAANGCTKLEKYNLATKKTSVASSLETMDRASREESRFVAPKGPCSQSLTKPSENDRSVSRNDAPGESLDSNCNSDFTEQSQQPEHERFVLKCIKMPSQSQSDSGPTWSHNIHLHCQQESQADMSSNGNGEDSEPGIESQQFLSQHASHDVNLRQVERQQLSSQKKQDASGSTPVKSQQDLDLSQQAGYKAPSISFQGLHLATESQNSRIPKKSQAFTNQSTTQMSQKAVKPPTELRTEPNIGEACSQSNTAPFSQQDIGRNSSTGNLASPTSSSQPYRQAMTQASPEAHGPLDDPSEATGASSATSSVLSMPCAAIQPSTQTSLVVLENEKSQLKMSSIGAADYNSQIQLRHMHGQHHSIRTLEHWKELQAGETLRSKSSRALTKLILAKNGGCSNPASFWLPALLDDIPSSVE